jgi:hypothetical protein
VCKREALLRPSRGPSNEQVVEAAREKFSSAAARKFGRSSRRFPRDRDVIDRPKRCASIE